MIEAEVRLVLSSSLPVLSVTDSIQDLLGFHSRDYLEGTISLKDQIHPHDRDIADVLFSPEPHLKSGIFNIRLRQSNGRVRCIKVRYSKESGAQGIELHLLLQEAKSLNRTMADAHLGTSLRTMLESTDDYIYFKDRNHVFTGASQTLVAITDSAKQWSDLLGLTDYDVFPEELADVYYDLEKQVFAGTPVAREIQQYLSKDGRRGWVDNRKYPIRDANDEIIGLYGVARDITELREAESQLLRLNRALRVLSECSMTLVRVESEEQLLTDVCQLVVDTGGYLLAWVGFAYQDAEKSVHPAAQYGFEDGYLESIQISWSEDPDIGRGPTGTAIRTGITQVNQNVWTNPNMVPWREQAIRRGYRSSIALPLSDAGKIIGALAVYSAEPDAFGVDETALLEELAANLTFGILMVRARTEKAAAERASSAKSAFLANMSHEIRTPMNSILGMTSILRREGVTPKQMERLDTISASAQHLLSVINDILDISKIEAGKLTLEAIPVSASNLLGNVRSILSESAKAKNIQLLIENAALPSNLLGDPMRLQQAVLNYASNALKFTQAGSVVMRTVKLDEAADWALVRFEVEDTGIGISPEVLSRLFSAFEQADNAVTRKYGGTGLGLAITRRLAELMGGAVGVESTLGVGSKFWFTARLTKGADAEVKQAAPKVNAEQVLRQRYAGTRILVADDEPVNREIAQILLEDIGLVVDTAADGGQAVSIARERPYAAVFMDMQMPQVDGLEAARQLREISGYRHTPIIAMTANVFAEEKLRCFEAGMNDFLSKPCDPDALFATLLLWLDRHPN